MIHGTDYNLGRTEIEQFSVSDPSSFYQQVPSRLSFPPISHSVELINQQPRDG